jgi:UDP-3-O-[3-hydroxymyristoyl] N-acetylglucosamine deacetylase
VLFVRTDLAHAARLPARAEWVTETTLATTLGNGAASVSTVEHLLSALTGMGVDNCTIEVSGPEVPIMDGSAAPFVYMLQQAGVKPQRRLRRKLVIRRPIQVREGNRWVRVIPSRELKVSVAIEFPHRAIGSQSLRSLRITPDTYAREIAGARTFGFLREVEMLKSKGLALGGSLQNAIVLDEHRVLNHEGLRFADEFARHKVLDIVGDLALLGLPLQGHVKASRSGHSLHQALVAEIRANPDCWTVEIPEPVERPARAGTAVRVPRFAS